MKYPKARFVLAFAIVLEWAALAGGAAHAQEAEEAPAPQCVQAKQLWSDDFETGDLSHWTSNSYVSTLHRGGCHRSDFSTDRINGGDRAHVTSIGCAARANHRVYGGLQFSGDEVLPRFTNTGTGIDAPNGIVVTFWSWLDAPGFGNGRWMSLFTTNNQCNYSDRVVTFGLEDETNRITPAHVIQTGGTVEDMPERGAFPMRQWTRTSVYLNYHKGEFHVWQDGVSQMHGTFRRNSKQICQFHWGLYANGANNAITLFEDDMSVWKLEEPLASFDQEPWLGETLEVCE
jgi:hypothetical protein